MSDLIRHRDSAGAVSGGNRARPPDYRQHQHGRQQKALCQGSGRLGSQHPQAAQRPQHSLREPAAVHLQRAEKYAPHFHDSGTDPKRWSDYFQKMWDNVSWLIPEKRKELREAVYQMVEDRFRGPKFTRQFLEVLIEVFADFRSKFEQDRQKVLAAPRTVGPERAANSPKADRQPRPAVHDAEPQEGD